MAGRGVLRSHTTRLLRGALLVLVIAVVAWVVGTLRRPRPAPPTPPPAESDAGEASRIGKIVHRMFQEGREGLVLEAEKWVGKGQGEVLLEGVEARFGYQAQGEAGSSTIRSESCVYKGDEQEADFSGNVEITTEDGFWLRSDTLVYRGDRGVARTDMPVEFGGQGFSGGATGLDYLAEQGRINLRGDVTIRLEGHEQEEPVEIKSRRAELRRAEGVLRFDDDVEVRRGETVVTAGWLLVNLTEQQTMEQAQFRGGFDLRASPTDALPGMGQLPAALGERHLSGGRLDLRFRLDRSLESAVAMPQAELALRAAQQPERHLLKAGVLAFSFDELGQLSELRGMKGTFLEIEAIAPARAPKRTMSCRWFVARFDSATGEVDSVDFNEDVVFVRGSQRATGFRAFYTAQDSQLILRQDPQLVDDGRDTRLAAQDIYLDAKTGNIKAIDHVRNTYRRAGSTGLLGSSETPTIVTCPFFDYDAGTATAVYRQGALLRSGADEVRAEEIQIEDSGQGKRRVTATGDVVSRMQPRAISAEAPLPAVVEGRAGKMVYEEALGEIVYTGEVVIRQGDIVTRSPKAILRLTEDGASILELIVGEPVEVRQGERTAEGRLGIYTPADQTMVLEGEPVVLIDPTQQVQGRSVTFKVGGDRILIEGREEVRTQTIIRQQGPPP